MELRMILKGNLFYTMGTWGSGSTFRSVFWVLWHMSPMPAPAFPFVLWLSMGQSVLVSVSVFFYVPHPATCSKMIFVSTLVAPFAYVMSSLFFFDLTHFLTSKCFIAWNSSSVPHTIFSGMVCYWHHSTKSLICWSSWSIDSCSPCLSLYISLMWFQ